MHTQVTILPEENIPLALLTTFCIGGPARFFIRIERPEQLPDALAFARERQLPVFILGGGSNVLIDDAGFAGVVVKIETKGITFEQIENKDEIIVTAEAGESWDNLVLQATKKNLWSIENLSGIPGTVGAAPVQNIGAYGAELADTFLWLEAFDREQNTTVRFAKEECLFGYRTSVFKKTPGRFVVLRVALVLHAGGAPNTTYKDLAQAYERGAPKTPAEVRAAVLAIRAAKFPDITREGTAGSFFLNPIVSVEKARALKEKYPDLPQFAAPQGEGVKVSFAWLLDHVLGLRGYTHGAARLYEKQPLVIAAARGASAHDVRALAADVIAIAEKNFEIKIETEVQIIF